MTPIATKNNAIILKDGKLAENCGCCGDWWCYDGAASGDCFCICEDPARKLPNVLLFNCAASSWNTSVPNWPNPDTAGDISLVRPTSCTTLGWYGSYMSGSVAISVSVVCTNCSSNTQAFGEGMNLLWYPSGSPGLSYSNTFLTATGFSAGYGKEALNALCNGQSLSAYRSPNDPYFAASVRRGD